MFPCSSCERYLHAGTEKCPFCGAATSHDSAPPAVSMNPTPPGRQRLSRAASYAVRAAIVAAPAALFACDSGESSLDDSGDNTATNTGSEASNSSSSSNSNSSSNSVTASSGGNPTTSTGIVINTGSTTGGEAGAGNGGSAGDIGIPIYGGPFPDMSEAKV